MAWFSCRFPTLRDPVDHPATRGELDGRGAVVGREGVPTGEAPDVASEPDHLRGDDGSDTEELGERSARRSHCLVDPPVRDLELSVETTHFVQELSGKLVADLLGRSLRSHRLQEALHVRNADLLCDSAGCDLEQQGVETADHPVAQASDLDVALGVHPQHLGVVGRHDRSELRSPKGGHATERASFASFLLDLPDASTRTLDDNVGGTSTTSSPLAMSCWLSR
jgi:hypothetical protein